MENTNQANSSNRLSAKASNGAKQQAGEEAKSQQVAVVEKTISDIVFNRGTPSPRAG
jgi:hypothetical protein